MKLLSKNDDFISFLGENPLISASIRVTSRCNLRCKHCYATAGEPIRNELGTDELLTVLDELAELRTLGVFFTGGEPFLRKDMVEILEYASHKDLSIYISTNGTLINEDVLKELKGLNFELFQVSLDGATPQVHDDIRGSPGTFEKAINAIQLASQILGKNVAVGTVIMKRNYEEVPKVMELAAKLGADIFALIVMLVTGRAEKEQDPNPKEKAEIIQTIFDKYRDLEGRMEFACNTTLPSALVPKEFRGEEGIPTFALCSFPYLLGINANGNVAPCDGFLNVPGFVAGNIRERSVREIWEKSKIFQKIRAIDADNLKGVCSKCKFREYCKGGCRTAAYLEYGDLRMPDPICQKMYEEKLFPIDSLS